MTKPKISIIVTAYNVEKYLEQCLNSLAQQTLTDIQVICVDDKSTDQTPQLLDEYTKKDKRFIVLHNTENIGLSGSRNRGMAQALAPYLMFCDSDDYYEPEACAHLYDAITTSNADLAIGGIKTIYHAHPEMKISDDGYYALKYSGLHAINDDLVTNTDYATVNKIFRKSIIDQYDIQFPVGLRYEDAFFCCAYFSVIKTVFYLNEIVYNYIRRSGSIMSTTWSSKTAQDYSIDHLYIMFNYFEFLQKHHIFAEHAQLFWRLFESYENLAINNSKTRANAKLARTKATNFIQQHASEFAYASPTITEGIKRISANHFYISPVRIKRFLLRFMPVYCSATGNIHALRSITLKQQQLAEQIDQLSQAHSDNSRD